jgi:predicted dehydrogenase
VVKARSIRVGIVGAGNNSRSKHIPGFKSLPEVEVSGVANRSLESGQRVADEFGIPRVYSNWLELVHSAEIDAVCIGTWPYMHCPITLAALKAGKHVLTEARMAMDAAEAKLMYQASLDHPDLVTQIVPFPGSFKFDLTIQEILASNYLGDIVAIDITSNQNRFADFDGTIQWRQDRELSGYNILNMGMWYEGLMRWVGPATRVSAMCKVTVHSRKDSKGDSRTVTIPDHVDILCEMGNGSQARLQFSAVTGFGGSNKIWIYGTEGTLHLDASTMTLYLGSRTSKSLEEIPIHPDKVSTWRVEEEFINAIRGQEPVSYTTFKDGLAYMEFTQAVTKSSRSGQTVHLPL